MAICNSCGADLSATTRFCVKCGAPREGVTPTPESWRDPSGELHQRGPASEQPPTVRFTPPERPPTGQANRPPAGYATPPQPQQPGTYMPPNYAPPMPAPPAPFAPRHQPPFEQSKSGQMPQASMTLGIVAACVMVVGLVPCLGWLNWLTLSLAFPAIIVSLIALSSESNSPEARNKAMIGLGLAAGALFLGGFRLLLGGGCL